MRVCVNGQAWIYISSWMPPFGAAAGALADDAGVCASTRPQSTARSSAGDGAVPPCCASHPIPCPPSRAPPSPAPPPPAPLSQGHAAHGAAAVAARAGPVALCRGRRVLHRGRAVRAQRLGSGRGSAARKGAPPRCQAGGEGRGPRLSGHTGLQLTRGGYAGTCRPAYPRGLALRMPCMLHGS